MMRSELSQVYQPRYLVLINHLLKIYESDDAFESGEPCVGHLTLFDMAVDDDRGTTSKGYFRFDVMEASGRR